MLTQYEDCTRLLIEVSPQQLPNDTISRAAKDFENLINAVAAEDGNDGIQTGGYYDEAGGIRRQIDEQQYSAAHTALRSCLSRLSGDLQKMV